MKSSLIVLPFIAIVLAAVAVLTGVSLTDIPIVSYVSWALSVSALILWFVLDWSGFKQAFSKKGTARGLNSGVAVILGIAVAFAIGFLSKRDRFNLSFDVSRDGINTLSDQSKKAIDSLMGTDKSLSLKTFFQDDLKQNKFEAMIAKYQAAGLEVDIKYIDPQLDPAAALSANITSADTVIFNLGEKESRVSVFSEEKMTNALLLLMKDSQKSIAFITGHGERKLEGMQPEEYGVAKQELEAESYIVSPLNLIEQNQPLNQFQVVIIAGPKYDYRENEIEILRRYARAGGSILIMLDAMTYLPNLQNFGKELGLEFSNDLLLLRPDDPRAQILGQTNAIITEFDEFSPVTRDFSDQGAMAMVLPNVRSIQEVQDNELKLKPSLVAKTSEIVIGVSNIKAAEDLANIEPEQISSGPFAMIAVATGQVGGEKIAKVDDEKVATDSPTESASSSKELRVVGVGTSEIGSNLGVQRAENLDMFLNLVNYLAQDDAYISIRPKDIEKSILDMSSVTSQISLQFISFLYPFLFLIIGVFYWLRRRRA
ncbi:MAG: GldG family protein [Pseudobacteriovorax sp.]|nr:GldG family protein [Pseudobacteriovorax sp.]